MAEAVVHAAVGVEPDQGEIPLVALAGAGGPHLDDLSVLLKSDVLTSPQEVEADLNRPELPAITERGIQIACRRVGRFGQEGDRGECQQDRECQPSDAHRGSSVKFQEASGSVPQPVPHTPAGEQGFRRRHLPFRPCPRPPPILTWPPNRPTSTTPTSVWRTCVGGLRTDSGSSC